MLVLVEEDSGFFFAPAAEDEALDFFGTFAALGFSGADLFKTKLSEEASESELLSEELESELECFCF